MNSMSGIEALSNTDLSNNIRILAFELVMIKSDLMSYAYDNKNGNKRYALATFRNRLDKLYTLCYADNIGDDLKKEISNYLKSNIKPTQKTLIYSIDIFERLFFQLQEIGKIPR